MNQTTKTILLIINVAIITWSIKNLTDYHYRPKLDIIIVNPTREQVTEWLHSHNGSAPPASWYPNGDPWRGLTAEELESMFEETDVAK